MLFCIRRVAMGVFAALGCFLWGSAGRACLTIAAEGPPPRITDESAVIIWDKDKGVEHFIRRATFDTQAAQLAFLVPTPTTPELGEANDTLFSLLQNLMKPEIEERIDRRLKFYWLLFEGPQELASAAMEGVTISAMPRVEIIGERKVAGYDATILKATDAAALNAYLQRNGYPASKTITQWLRPYVEKGWIITAFKVSRSGEGVPGGMGDAPQSARPRLDAVRMSFSTPRPFYPYHEPPAEKNAATYPRSLRIFLLSNEGRMAATLGENGPAWGTENIQRIYAGLSSATDAFSQGFRDDLGVSVPNHTGVEWAGKIGFGGNYNKRGVDKAEAKRRAGLPSKGELPESMTVFLDTQSPRPGTDELYFAPSADQSDIKPKPIYHYTREPFALIPMESFFALPLAAVGLVAWRRLRFR